MTIIELINELNEMKEKYGDKLIIKACDSSVREYTYNNGRSGTIDLDIYKEEDGFVDFIEVEVD